jgi:D-ribose pyranase
MISIAGAVQPHSRYASGNKPAHTKGTIGLKKTSLLNHQVSDVIARLGHTQRLIIGDAGLPIPAGVQRIDLAVSPGLPTVMELARAIATEMQVEAIVVADELLDRDSSRPGEIRAVFPGASFASLPHESFKAESAQAIAIVRTGQCTQYANVMLISGVTF